MIINTDLIYPVGSIYITTDTTFNPNKKFGGTWLRLEGDVYLKNVPLNSEQPIGNYGGTSIDHKIPISSMPSHTHNLYGANSGENYPITNTGNDWAPTTRGWTKDCLTSTGGGQPYYPYYYGIICWHRTA